MTTLTIPIELELTPRSRAVMDALYKCLSPQFKEPAPAPTSSAGQTVLPAIGEPWPSVGGAYAGIAKGMDGEPDGHLVLLADKPDSQMDFADAVEWANSLGDGARLPTRFEAALLYANLRDSFDLTWHWTGTQYSATNAWQQRFTTGNQSIYDKDVEVKARAVRRFPI